MSLDRPQTLADIRLAVEFGERIYPNEWREDFCNQHVEFGSEGTTDCWAHMSHCRTPLCATITHACDRPGIDRLGLCQAHRKEILGS